MTKTHVLEQIFVKVNIGKRLELQTAPHGNFDALQDCYK